MVEWTRPGDLRGLRGFLGLTGYYRRFIKNYGKIAAPLTALLKKNAFQWGDQAQAAFESLKGAMVTAPVLAMPDFNLPFEIETDACGVGVGAVLMQQGRPIAYYSQQLSQKAQQSSVYEKELMAIVFAIKKWQHYLTARPFIIKTDQKALKYLLEQRVVDPDQKKWISKLMSYKFEIQYKPGRENRAADALSRRGVADMKLQAFSLWQYADLEEFETETAKDTKLSEIWQQVLMNQGAPAGYSIDKGCLRYNGRLVLPRNSPKTVELIREFHNSPLGGHSGYLRTYKRLATVVYWEGMKRDIQTHVARCDICQRNKYEAVSPAGLLQPLPIPQHVWEDISMDFIVGMPKVRKYDTIMVVVDRFTKYAHFLPLSHPFTAKDVAEKFIAEVVRLHGFPKSIVSDRDRIFISQFWRELFSQSGTTLKFSSGYHPQTDGQTEVVNRSLETFLRCFAGEDPKKWVRLLPWAEFWFNTSFNRSLGTSPFKALYGRDPPTILKWQNDDSLVEDVNEQIRERNEVLMKLKCQLAQAQGKMKEYADKKRRDVEFQEGEKVYLKVQPYKLKNLTKKLHEKLAPRFYGPYEILQKIGKVAYKLKLPDTARIHPTFHVSQLKRSLSPYTTPQALPEFLTEDYELRVYPENILKVRKMTDGSRQVLVKWKQLPECESTWEDLALLAKQFPELHLEDKVLLLEGSDDGPATNMGRTY